MPLKPQRRGQEQDKKFRLLFEDNPQPMWVLDPASRRFLETNAAASALYGYHQDEFRGMTLDDVQAGDETVDDTITSRSLTSTPAVWRHRTRAGRVID